MKRGPGNLVRAGAVLAAVVEIVLVGAVGVAGPVAAAVERVAAVATGAGNLAGRDFKGPGAYASGLFLVLPC
jgi:hypothetical protein